VVGDMTPSGLSQGPGSGKRAAKKPYKGGGEENRRCCSSFVEVTGNPRRVCRREGWPAEAGTPAAGEMEGDNIVSVRRAFAKGGPEMRKKERKIKAQSSNPAVNKPLRTSGAVKNLR